MKKGRLLLVASLLLFLSIGGDAAAWAQPVAPAFTLAGSFDGVSKSCVAVGDYDADGDMDIAIGGEALGGMPLTRVYRQEDSAFFGAHEELVDVRDCALDWGDFDRDGDLDLLLSGQDVAGEATTSVWQNENDRFNSLGPIDNYLQVYGADALWADFDRDGDLDVAIGGVMQEGDHGYSRLFINRGAYFTHAPYRLVEGDLPFIGKGAMAVGDYNGDGDYDLALTRTAGLHFYRQGTTKTFPIRGAGRLGNGLGEGALEWGDYDQDGDLDLLMTGSRASGNTIQSVIINTDLDRKPVLQEMDAGLRGVAGSDGSWGDYDLDGDLDILIAGADTSGQFVTLLYANEGGSFIEQNAGLPGVHQGSVAWTDIDEDGDLDILLTGMQNDGVPIAHLYRNELHVSNMRPSMPANLQLESVRFKEAVLTWERATDDSTPDHVISYSLRVGTTPGGSDVVAPHIVTTEASPTGESQVERPGNAGTTVRFEIAGLEANQTYYWSVQAIDQAFQVSASPPEQSFHTPVQPFQQMDQSAIPALRDAITAWGDYDNDGDLDLYIQGYKPAVFITEDPITPFAGLFRNDEGVFRAVETPFPHLYLGDAAWGDYDGDGDLDLVMQGQPEAVDRNPYDPISTLYRNNDGQFVEQITAFQGMAHGTVDWGDYDLDGDLDLLIAGSPRGSARAVDIFRNDAGQLGHLERFLFIADEIARWVDWDSDGDLDVMAIGGVNSSLLRNDQGVFTAESFEFPSRDPVELMAMGDFESDGDIDLFVSLKDEDSFFVRNGRTDGTSITEVGNLLKGDAEWVDFDGDGQLDLTTTGFTEYPARTQDRRRLTLLYRDSGEALIEQDLDVPAFDSGESISWADVDGDFAPDMLLSGGYYQGERVSLLLKNQFSLTNTPPEAPIDLDVNVISSDSVQLSWGLAADDTTPPAAITYNIRVGTAPGANDVMISMALPDGFRTVRKPGNVGNQTTLTLKGLTPNQTYYWSVQALDANFFGGVFASEQSFRTIESSPGKTNLASNFPNPFAGSTRIPFSLATESEIELEVLDVLGRQVAVLASGTWGAGEHQVTWKPTGVAPGVYFYRLRAGDVTKTNTLLLLR